MAASGGPAHRLQRDGILPKEAFQSSISGMQVLRSAPYASFLARRPGHFLGAARPWGSVSRIEDFTLFFTAHAIRGTYGVLPTVFSINRHPIMPIALVFGRHRNTSLAVASAGTAC